MKKKTTLKVGTYEKALEYQRIGNRAASQAQEENRHLGLPSIYWRNNKIIYEMPDGKVVIKENSQDNKKSEGKDAIKMFSEEEK